MHYKIPLRTGIYFKKLLIRNTFDCTGYFNWKTVCPFKLEKLKILRLNERVFDKVLLRNCF